MPIQRPRRWRVFNDIYWIAGGKPKTGGIASLAEVFPAHPQSLSDRRGGEGFAQTLEGRVPYEISGVLFRRRSTRRPATPARAGSTSRSVLLFTGLRLFRPVP
jgi:UDP-N-acetylmuramoylalanine--D-glutamate ligase